MGVGVGVGVRMGMVVVVVRGGGGGGGVAAGESVKREGGDVSEEVLWGQGDRENNMKREIE